MQSHFRRDRALILALIVGLAANLGALRVAKSRTYTVPPPLSLPLAFHGWQGTSVPTPDSTRAILPHARITMAHYEQANLPPTDLVVIASRDPNDMHTPERCFMGSGFDIVSVERQNLSVPGPEGGSWTLNRMLTRSPETEELVLYCYDGVQMIGSSTIMARIAMKLGGARREPAYFIRVSAPTGGDVKATEARLTTFLTDLMRERHTWKPAVPPAP